MSTGFLASVGRLLLLFVVVPAVELALLIEIGSRIGTVPTLALIAGTGMLGATLARNQGLGVLQRIRIELDQGQIPADAVVDGVILLVASALLITPGVLTDAFGFLCLVPAFRQLLKRAAAARFERAAREGRVHVVVGTGGWGPPPPHHPDRREDDSHRGEPIRLPDDRPPRDRD